MLKWFKGVKTQKEAKSLYHKLCRQYHPDISGRDTTAEMQEINAEFERVFEALPKDSKSKATENNTTERQEQNGNETTRQTAQRFMKIIQRLVKCEGLTIEIVGSWIWLSGDTYKYMRCIKQMGFMYSAKHKKYYLSDGDSTRRGSRYTFEQICDRYGVEKMEAEKTAKLTI